MELNGKEPNRYITRANKNMEINATFLGHTANQNASAGKCVGDNVDKEEMHNAVGVNSFSSEENDKTFQINIDRWDKLPSSETLCMTKRDEIFVLKSSKPSYCRKFNKSGKFEIQIHDELLHHPIDVATWSNGEILLSDTGESIGDGKILLFSSCGDLVSIFVSQLTSPVGIDTDLEDNVYVCDRKDNCVLKFNRRGYLCHVFKIFNVPFFVSTCMNGDFVVSDMNGIYCLNETGTQLWKKSTKTGCKFCVLSCCCVVLEYVDVSNGIEWPGQPVIALLEKDSEYVLAKIHHGVSGIYLDSNEKVWIGVASESYFQQLQFHHEHKDSLYRSPTTRMKKEVGNESLLSSRLTAISIEYLDCSNRYRRLASEGPFFEISYDNRLNRQCDKLMVTYERGENFIPSDNFTLSKVFNWCLYSKTTVISQNKMENIIVQDIDCHRPSSIDNALLSICDCRTNHFNNLVIVHTLLTKGANVNAKASCGNTALHLAVENKKEQLIRLLLSYGADPSALNDTGDSPLSLSIMYSLTDSTKAMAWCLCRFFVQTHQVNNINMCVWPGYKPRVGKFFKSSRKKRMEIVSTLRGHIDNQRDICSHLHMHCSWTEKKSRIFNEDTGVYLVSQTDRRNTDEIPDFRGLKIEWRGNFAVCPEATHLDSNGLLRIKDISDELAKSIARAIKSEASSLFSKHSNLNIISPSGVKSSGFLSGKHTTALEVSIGLYCKVKGIIPLGEKEFPQRIGTFPTDVREGYVVFGNGPRGPNDYHANLKTGCCISVFNGSSSGTLGGFVEKENDTYFITAAHSLFDCRALTNLSPYLKFSPVHVSQPTLTSANDSLALKPVGKVSEAVFSHGKHSKVSVDAALVFITDTVRTPVDGSIPAEKQEKLLAAGYDVSHPPEFSSGEILPTITEEYRRHDVIKYGAETGLTRGALNVDGSQARIENKELGLFHSTPFGNNRKTFTMYNQREVMGIGDHIFFDLGDSGAFVFMTFENEDPKCIGMAIGKTSYGSCIMTPISTVLERLGIKPPFKLKTFPRKKTTQNQTQLPLKTMTPYSLVSKTENKSASVDVAVTSAKSQTSESNNDLINVLKSINDSISKQFDSFNKRFDRIEETLENHSAKITSIESFVEGATDSYQYAREKFAVDSVYPHCSKDECNPLKRKRLCHNTSESEPSKIQKKSDIKNIIDPPSLPPDTPYEFDIKSVDQASP